MRLGAPLTLEQKLFIWQEFCQNYMKIKEIIQKRSSAGMDGGGGVGRRSPCVYQ